MNLESELQKMGDPVKAKGMTRYFQVKEGEYGYGDEFLGISMPDLRKFIKDVDIPLEDIKSYLFSSKYHEVRMVGVLLLEKMFPDNRSGVYSFYLEHARCFNNWDFGIIYLYE